MQVNGNIAPKSIVFGVADSIPYWGRRNFRKRDGKFTEVLPGFLPLAC